MMNLTRKHKCEYGELVDCHNRYLYLRTIHNVVLIVPQLLDSLYVCLVPEFLHVSPNDILLHWWL